MARLVHTHPTAPGDVPRPVTAGQRRAGERRLQSMTAKNPLRRVLLPCHGWVRDSTAVVGDWLFCEKADCQDLRRVTEVVE